MKREDITNVKFGSAKVFTDESGEIVIVESTSIESITHNKQNSNHFTPYIGNFYASALRLIETLPDSTYSMNDFGIVPSYLFLHALELKLKEILHFIDNSIYSLSELRKNKFGHDISNLIKELKSKSLDPFKGVPDDQKDYIEKVFNQYKTKMFNYSDSISQQNPVNFDTSRIRYIADQIMANLENQFRSNLS